MSVTVGLRAAPRVRFARTPFRHNPVGRRWQTSSATVGAPSQSLLQRMWSSPVGIKTVHFWAPVMKWGLVLAGISDFARPAESLSLTQNAALTATGAIWTRWCFIIKPRNLFLAAVNFFLGCVGVTQVTRILLYQQSLRNATPGQVAEASAKEAKDTAKSIIEDPAAATKRAVK